MKFIKYTKYLNQWDIESLNYLITACKGSGEIKYLLTFLDCALNTKTTNNAIPKTEDRSRELYFAYFVNGEFHKQSQIAQEMKRTFKQ